MVRHDIVRSPAYSTLSPAARAIWIELLCRFRGYNNGEIPLSCREAQQLVNVGKNTAARGFQELMERGLIRIGQESGFSMKSRLARRWILTHEPLNDQPPTCDWRNWKPPEKQNTVP